MLTRMSTRLRFILATVLLLVPILVIALLLLDESFNRSQSQVVISEFATADVVAQSVSELVAGQQQGLQVLAETEPIRAIDQRPDEALALMDAYRLSRTAVSSVFLLGDNGDLIRSTGAIDVTTLPTSFQSAADSALMAGQPAVSDTILLPSGDVEVVAIIVPVYANADPADSAPEGTPVATDELPAQAPSGALGAFYSVERLVAGFQPATGFSTGSEIAIALVTYSGKVVSVAGGTSDPTQIFMDGEDLDSSIESALAGQRTRFTFTDPSGLERSTVAVPIPLPGADWAALVAMPVITSYGPVNSLIDTTLIALLAGLLISILLAIGLASWLTRPYRQLTTQAEALASGGTVAPLESGGPVDADELSRSIREMADRLNSQVRDTETAREEIARQAERLRDLLRRTVRLQEDERRRIASDIHDAVSPLITGAMYQTQAIRIAISNGNGSDEDHDPAPEQQSESESLQQVSDLLERAMRELHDVIFDLRPPDLDDIGIVAALQRHVDQVNRSGLFCTLEVVGEERRLPPEVRLAVYRIAQEALHNAVRHARADECVVRIEWLPDRLRVTIQDDGSGFDVVRDGRRTGLGLMSMRERAAAIGASLDIVSREGSGTAIVVERVADEIDLVMDPAAVETDRDDDQTFVGDNSIGIGDDSDEENDTQ